VGADAVPGHVPRRHHRFRTRPLSACDGGDVRATRVAHSRARRRELAWSY
jgi:hypothetical protein